MRRNAWKTLGQQLQIFYASLHSPDLFIAKITKTPQRGRFSLRRLAKKYKRGLTPIVLFLHRADVIGVGAVVFLNPVVHFLSFTAAVADTDRILSNVQ